MAEGVDGLLRDRTRPPGIAPLAPSLVDKVVALALEPPSHEATHWTVRAIAKAVGIAASWVVRIWHDHCLAPHRWRSFKLSNDKPVLSEVEGAFAEKLHDVVGLYVSPPANAIVLSVDEKSQIQALDRTQPGLPLKRDRGATMTHDYKRNGDDHAVRGAERARRLGGRAQHAAGGHQEFIRFLNAVEAELPSDKAVHVILDNYATHKQPKVRAWLARHSRWTFHFVIVPRFGEHGFGPFVVRPVPEFYNRERNGSAADHGSPRYTRTDRVWHPRGSPIAAGERVRPWSVWRKLSMGASS